MTMIIKNFQRDKITVWRTEISAHPCYLDCGSTWLFKAYSGTLSRRNLRRLWAIKATLGDLSKNGRKNIATLGDLRRF